MTVTLSNQQVELVHLQIVQRTGGSLGIRDRSLLDSALQAPFQGFDRVEFFPSILEKAARLGHGLIMNHPFVDGNKRIGAHVMLLFLRLNGIELQYTQQELVDITLAVASKKKDYVDLLDWLTQHKSSQTQQTDSHRHSL